MLFWTFGFLISKTGLGSELDKFMETFCRTCGKPHQRTFGTQIHAEQFVLDDHDAIDEF